MFQKLVAIEPVNLVPVAVEALHTKASSVILHSDRPADDAEIIRRIGDADCVLVSYTTIIGRAVIEACPNLRYIGMCCSLYSEQSANVDIACAREHGIVVTGIRDYGDEGAVEFVVSELIRLLHGFGGDRWSEKARELTGMKIGMIGLGTLGGMIARGLQYFGAQPVYFSRTRKPDAEAQGIAYLPLHDLLHECETVVTCLNRNTVLLHEAEFAALGDRKIMFNMGLSPAFDPEPFRAWISRDNRFFSDTEMALNDPPLLSHPHVCCARQSAGMTEQAVGRLSQKVLANMQSFLQQG